MQRPSELIRVKERPKREWADAGECRRRVREAKDGGDGEEARRLLNLFYPTPYDGPEVFIEAKGMCRQCPVRPECLAYSITYWEKVGIWGGETETERRVTRREMRADEVAEEDAVEWARIHVELADEERETRDLRDE